MSIPIKLTAEISREEDMYVALCPELDVVSQGNTVAVAKANLQEAVELYLECASEEELKQRIPFDTEISTFEVSPH